MIIALIPGILKTTDCVVNNKLLSQANYILSINTPTSVKGHHRYMVHKYPTRGLE